MKLGIIFTILLAALSVMAAATRTLDADAFRSSDRSKTYNLPSITGSDDLLTVSGTQNVRNKTLISPTVSGTMQMSGATINSGTVSGSTLSNNSMSGATITSSTIGGTISTLSGGTVSGSALSGGTITNADIDGSTASNSSRITLPKASTATLSGLTRKQGNVFYNTTTGKVNVDTGSALEEVTTVATVSNPTVTRLTSGTAATYTPPSGVQWLKVLVLGGGGGGLGSNQDYTASLSTSSLTSGGASYFISSVSGTVIAATGGSAGGGGIFDAQGGAGGSGSVSQTSAVVLVNTVSGQRGGHGWTKRTASDIMSPASYAHGGGNCLYPALISGEYGVSAGRSASANTGVGGGGAGGSDVTVTMRMGGAGGGGGCAQAIITNPSALGTITYTIGSGGVGATGSTYTGGSGGSGLIIVEEYYVK